jgi:hypothetical protein
MIRLHLKFPSTGLHFGSTPLAYARFVHFSHSLSGMKKVELGGVEPPTF